ncbi:hypothetical protein ACQPYA_28230 [Micromonospora sp. CA-263727]|uniref:hypothetical protein n=1 Tax=Micromonospora sp. CA-263727 TaxID=3239967 RepID=UPI003D92AFC7
MDLRAVVAFAAGADFRGAAFRAPVPAAAFLAAPAVVLRTAPVADFRVLAAAVFRAVPPAAFRAVPPVALRTVPPVAFRADPARLAGAALARPGAVRPAAACLVPAAFVALARPAGPVLRRAAPPDRSVFTSVFTSSGLRRAEMPETPYRRNCPRMSSTRIREISDSEIPGVFGLLLPACRLVLVAVPPRPELFR